VPDSASARARAHSTARQENGAVIEKCYCELTVELEQESKAAAPLVRKKLLLRATAHLQYLTILPIL